MPCSRATATMSATGCTVPTSLLAHITLTSATEDGSASMAARTVPGCTRPCASTSSQVTSAPSCRDQEVDAVQDGVVLDRADQQPDPARVGVTTGVEEALDREVVGLGATGGEQHLGGPRAQRLGDRLAGLLDHPARTTAGGVQRGGVAHDRHLGRHRLDHLRQHGRGGRVVEVDGGSGHRTSLGAALSRARRATRARGAPAAAPGAATPAAAPPAAAGRRRSRPGPCHAGAWP